jgi:hypothetical protein
MRPPSDSKNGFKKIAIEKARDRFPGAGSIVATMTMCR